MSDTVRLETKDGKYIETVQIQSLSRRPDVVTWKGDCYTFSGMSNHGLLYVRAYVVQAKKTK